MCTMRANGEQELEQQFIGIFTFRVVDAPVLSPDLAELARPVGQQQRASLVLQSRVGGAFRSVVTRSSEPAALELEIARQVVAESVLQAGELVAPAPDQFGSADKRAVNRPLQRTPAHRR